ncbi:hypothetical protein CU098_009827 [Rhizopus stolonifer]|uniref:Uncharacterized protein n=1 Tax=Rhizopus stolonifer TaxID=4846 RepID=A0A367K9G9_RHIST|nr:hypothetical protein CU098_009827 [Rhizopus stolonifer]
MQDIAMRIVQDSHTNITDENGFVFRLLLDGAEDVDISNLWSVRQIMVNFSKEYSSSDGKEAKLRMSHIHPEKNMDAERPYPIDPLIDSEE